MSVHLVYGLFLLQLICFVCFLILPRLIGQVVLPVVTKIARRLIAFLTSTAILMAENSPRFCLSAFRLNLKSG